MALSGSSKNDPFQRGKNSSDSVKRSSASIYRTNSATLEELALPLQRLDSNNLSKKNATLYRSATFMGMTDTFKRAFSNVSPAHSQSNLMRQMSVSNAPFSNTDRGMESIGKPSQMSTAIPHHTLPLEEIQGPTIRLFYVTPWKMPFIHYNNNRESPNWTQVPGQLLFKISKDFSPHLCPTLDLNKDEILWCITIRGTSWLEFVLNDSKDSWDKTPNNTNYVLEDPGSYLLRHGKITPVLPIPGKPIILLAKAIGVTSISLGWNPPVLGENLVAGYNIYRNKERVGTVPLDSIYRTDQDTLEEGPASPEGGDAGADAVGEDAWHRDRRVFVDAGLYGSTAYTYTVSSYNEMGEEAVSGPLVIKTAEPDRAGPVDSLSLVPVNKTTIEISWKTPLDTGGGIIQAYRVWRDGVSVGVVPQNSAGYMKYLDENLVENEVHLYSVTAGLDQDAMMQSLAAVPEEGLEDLYIGLNKIVPEATSDTEVTSEIEDEWKKKILSGIVFVRKESPMIYFVHGKAKKVAAAPRLFDKQPHILLQAFNWKSCYNKQSWYSILSENAANMHDCGVSILWMPPPSQSVAPQGYMPSKLFNVDSAYGSKERLLSLMKSLEQNGIAGCVDFVANHRCGSKQDQYGQWTMFEEPEWGPWAIVSNNKQGYHSVSNAQDSGAQSDCAPDINHNNNDVKRDIKRWLKFLFDDIGYKALRIDMAPGYGTNHQVDYVQEVDNPFSVGEYWSGDVNVLKNYVNACRRRVAAFDFAFYYVVRRCVETNDYSEMCNHGRLNGLVGQDPGLSVTFIDNHDTEHLDFVGKFCNGDATKIMQGYAILLTHPGTPTIYWTHFSDYGKEMNEELKALGQARRNARVHSDSKITIKRNQQNLYAAYINGDHYQGVTKTLAMKVGWESWQPDGSGWEMAAKGNGYCVWIK